MFSNVTYASCRWSLISASWLWSPPRRFVCRWGYNCCKWVGWEPVKWHQYCCAVGVARSIAPVQGKADCWGHKLVKPSAHVSLDHSLASLHLWIGVRGAGAVLCKWARRVVYVRVLMDPPVCRNLHLEVWAVALCRSWGGVPDALEAGCGHSAHYLLARHSWPACTRHVPIQPRRAFVMFLKDRLANQQGWMKPLLSKSHLLTCLPVGEVLTDFWVLQ